jgi:hypothetical protein
VRVKKCQKYISISQRFKTKDNKNGRNDEQKVKESLTIHFLSNLVLPKFESSMRVNNMFPFPTNCQV